MITINKENILKRSEIAYKCNLDLVYRAYCIERSRRDPAWWFDTFVVTYDPRRHPAIIPFTLFPKQRECIAWIDALYRNGQWGILEKSRDTGASWLAVGYAVHHWLFEEHFAAGFGSRKADLVDSGSNPDSLFEKMRMLIRRLPKWMIPNGWEKASRIGMIVNPENGATICGEAGDNIGRGGRKSIYFGDEFAFIERSQKVIAALSQNTDCFIGISTPNGTNNEQYRMRSSGNFPVFRIHWSDDPRRNRDWYDQKKLQLPDFVIAQEYDINYTASVEGVLIKGTWVSSAINAHYRLPEMEKVANKKQAGLDVAGSGANKTVLIYRRGCVVTNIQDWCGISVTQTAFKVDSNLRQDGIKYLVFDSDGIGCDIAGTLETIIGDFPYQWEPFHGSGAPTNTFWSAEEKYSKEKFYNARAEAYWVVRERFRKTYEHLEGIREYELDELISIPNHPELIMQLSQPTIKYSTNGKLLIESKEDLKKRGLSSPDFADSLVYCFWESSDLSWLGNV